MRHLDLFSGIGGFALAARRVGWETVGFCEIDPYCQKVLAKNFPGVPIHDDIHTFSGSRCDIITAGYPCQPYATAGERRGDEDDRALWPEVARLLREVRPQYFVGENVNGHITMGLDQVLSDLEALDYSTRTLVIPAAACDAPHRRYRCWILADAFCGRQQGQGQPVEPIDTTPGATEQAANRVNGGQVPTWRAEPGVDRVANGIPNGMDRLKGLGNAIVPQVAEVIFRAL